jgi:O-antigen/teichoic acid export membrane protein
LSSLVKKLAQQTVIYGLSSIVGRFLNYLLVPLHTRIFLPAEYGVVTEFYAYVAFLNILFTYGMETAFFRFSTRSENKAGVYHTSLTSLLFTSILFSSALILFAKPIATALGHADHHHYVTWFALILALDTLVAIPFARLRQENRPMRFAFFKLLNIGVNVGFNLLFLLLIPWILSHQHNAELHLFLRHWYSEELGVGYVFLSNLIASAVTFVALSFFFRELKLKIDFTLWKQMLWYALPLILVGLAGMVDEKLSVILLKYRLPVSPQEAQHAIGIFGACYKLSILMTLFIQAYRMAAEPFFFNESTKANPQLTYARMMNYFSIFCCFIFLSVSLFLDVFAAVFLSEKYFEGLRIVPVLLLANFFLGVYYNLTIWYKLTDKTNLGAIVAVYGAVITFLLNWWLIPVFGYMGSAAVTLICYSSMTVISYFLGQKYYPVPYNVGRFFFYLFVAGGLVALAYWLKPQAGVVAYYFSAVLLMAVFALTVYLLEVRNRKPLKAM